jgi:hypothetical protein
MARSASGYDDDSGEDTGALRQRSRRAMLAGGAAGALGVIGLETLGTVGQASAATDVAASRHFPSASSPLPLTAGGTGLSTSSVAELRAELGVLPEAGGALTGGLAPTVVALKHSDGLVLVNASHGNVFTLTLTASGWMIASPVSPVGDGQVVRIRLIQDAAGGRTVVWGTAYRWGSAGNRANSAPRLTTTAHATDILGFEYVAAQSAWCFLGAAFPQGF